MLLKKNKCEIKSCKNSLPDDPAIIKLGEYEFKVCDECSKLMEVITDKYAEHEQQRIDNESF